MPHQFHQIEPSPNDATVGGSSVHNLSHEHPIGLREISPPATLEARSEAARFWWTRRSLNESPPKREEKTGGARRAPGVNISPRTFK
jgi:hypothetical protein